MHTTDHSAAPAPRGWRTRVHVARTAAHATRRARRGRRWSAACTFDVAMYDVDLFDAPQATIDALHARGVAVICDFPAGSYEDWRPDADAFPAFTLGNPLDGWPGERWLDTRSRTVRNLMRARLDLAVAALVGSFDWGSSARASARRGSPAADYDSPFFFGGRLC